MKPSNQLQASETKPTFQLLSAKENNPLPHFGVSTADWENLIANKGNADKADAWVRARLHEVENLSAGTQKAYLRIMTRNLS